MSAQTANLDLNVDPWEAVNDGVMGGISTGQMVAIDAGLRFQGTISLEHNGGFASARRPLKTGLAGIKRIRLTVKGDGRKYQLRLRLDNSWDGVSWRHEFNTDSSDPDLPEYGWQVLSLALNDFVPVFRGRIQSGYDSLEAARVHQLGFLLADGQARSFQLDIGAIEFLS